jgi:sulfonate transport system ATP-binding protein
MVTHDVDEAVALADRILVLDAGRIVAEERIYAERGARRGGAALRQRLLGHLGCEGGCR